MDRDSPNEPTLPEGTPSTRDASPPTAAAPAPGEGTPFGRYRLVRVLGRGGMGVVHEAWDSQLGRAVALKMLSPHGAGAGAGADGPDERAALRLLREARSAARLRHPSIVSIHDVGEIDGMPCFTMDLVEGRSLEEVLQANDSWTAFPMRRRVEVLAQVAEALGYAHAQGIVHRDVKPSNIMITSARAMLMDFGLAREHSGTSLGRELTVSGAILGTPRYMSPEQCGSEGAKGAIGPQSDVFSFGVVLYRAATGSMPFLGEGFEAILNTWTQEPSPPSRVNPRVHRDLETIILRCLEKAASRRFADGRDLAAELRRYLDGEPILSRPISFVARLWRRASKRRAVVALAAAAVLLSAGLWVALADRGAKARAAAAAEQRKKEAEGRERTQAQAMVLVERARSAFAQAETTFYDREASYEDMAAKIEAGQGLLEKAIAICPDLALAQYLLGMGWELRGWEDRAEEAYQEALAKDPGLGPAHYRLGRLFLTRAFLATLGSSAREMDFHRPEARRWSGLAQHELEAALKSGSGFDDALARTLASAMAAYTADDHAGAARMCEEGLARFARSTGREELLWLMGLTRAGGDWIECFTKAIAIRPKFPLALFCRGLAHGLAREFDAAMADYDEAIRAAPRFAFAHVNRGTLRSRLHEEDGAIADFTAAIEADPRCVQAWVDRADSYRQKGDRARALADCEEALKLDPAESRGLSNRACIREEQGDLDGALADCEAALAEDPKNAAAMGQRALIFQERGDLARAMEEVNRAIAADPLYPMTYNNRATLEMIRGDKEKALEDYAKAIALDPGMVDARYNRGTLRAQKGDLPGALADFEESLRRQPRHAKALAARGGVKALAGDAKGALADLDEAIRIDPSWVNAWQNRAVVKSQAGDLTGALADLDEACHRDPKNVQTLVTRATFRSAAGDVEGVIADTDAALALDPKNATALIYRGMAKGAKGNAKGALADYDAALAVAPESPEANTDRGMTLMALGDFEGARKSLQKALAVAPRDWSFRPQVEQALKQLK